MKEPTIKDVMKLLARATQCFYEVFVYEDQFLVMGKEDRLDYYRLQFPLRDEPEQYVMLDNKLKELEHERLWGTVRSRALNKLTKEERIALGIDV